MEVRRKKVDENGEWVYECTDCERWLPKFKFRGCTTFVDAYGNCLICSSCRASKAQKQKFQDEYEEIKSWMRIMGYDPDSDKPVWQQFHDRHGFDYPE